MLESRRPDYQGSDLHDELDGLRAMVNELAREDSMRRLETRWDGFEDRISGMDPSAIREDLITLSYRLDDIKSSIGQIPSALPLNALEDKIKMLVAAIDAMSRQPAASDPELARQFGLLDERLDEISRAIVATSVSQPSGVEASDIQRLESRLDAVVDHIDRLGRAGPDMEIAERIESLGARVEDLAGEQAYGMLMDRLDALSQSLNEQSTGSDSALVGQLEEISRKVDTLDLNSVNEHLGDQLKALSMRIDHINGDLAATNSNQDMLYGRLENLAEQVEKSFAKQQKVDFAPLEARLADIAARLDEGRNQYVPSDDVIRSLETQVADLSQLLAAPGSNAPLEPRLTAIENQLQSGQGIDRDVVIETARQAAEAAIANIQKNGLPAGDVSAIEALVGDLRSLEELSRRSDERNTRTIDAVHDTLVKIASRLERLESSPAAPSDYQDRPDAAPVMSDPVDQATPYADEPIAPQERDEPVAEDSKPFLAGLVQRVKGSKDTPDLADDHDRQDLDVAPSIDPVADIDPETANMPLEPGSGAPDIKRIMAKVREAQSLAQDDNPYADAGEQARADKADFIAAARRAARAGSIRSRRSGSSRSRRCRRGLVQEIKPPSPLAAGSRSHPACGDFVPAGLQHDRQRQEPDPNRFHRADCRTANARCYRTGTRVGWQSPAGARNGTGNRNQ